LNFPHSWKQEWGFGSLDNLQQEEEANMITQIARSIRGSAFEMELARIYIECFAEPPWNEVFSEAEVVEWFREMLGNPSSLGLVFWQNREVGGALFAIPVSEKPDVVEFLGDRCAPEECLYIAEVFVAKRFRRHGIGTALQTAALESAKERGFRFVSERTNFQLEDVLADPASRVRDDRDSVCGLEETHLREKGDALG